MNSLISPDPWESTKADIDWLNVDPWQLPSVALQDKNCLPNQGGIYFAIRQRRVLYIGKADRSLRGRWLTHHRYKQLEEIGEIRLAFYHPQVADLCDLERQLIKLFDPKFNDTPVKTISIDDVMALHQQQMAIKEAEIVSMKARHMMEKQALCNDSKVSAVLHVVRYLDEAHAKLGIAIGHLYAAISKRQSGEAWQAQKGAAKRLNDCACEISELKDWHQELVKDYKEYHKHSLK